jgi:hypothetical protein
LGAALKEDESKPVAERGALLNVEAIEAAIDLFTDPEGAAKDARDAAEEGAERR